MESQALEDRELQAIEEKYKGILFTLNCIESKKSSPGNYCFRLPTNSYYQLMQAITIVRSEKTGLIVAALAMRGLKEFAAYSPDLTELLERAINGQEVTADEWINEVIEQEINLAFDKFKADFTHRELSCCKFHL